MFAIGCNFSRFSRGTTINPTDPAHSFSSILHQTIEWRLELRTFPLLSLRKRETWDNWTSLWLYNMIMHHMIIYIYIDITHINDNQTYYDLGTPNIINVMPYKCKSQNMLYIHIYIYIYGFCHGKVAEASRWTPGDLFQCTLRIQAGFAGKARWPLRKSTCGFAQALQRRAFPFPNKCWCNFTKFLWEQQQRYYGILNSHPP